MYFDQALSKSMMFVNIAEKRGIWTGTELKIFLKIIFIWSLWFGFQKQAAKPAKDNVLIIHQQSNKHG